MAIGAEGASYVGAFVPADTEPIKVFEHGFREGGFGALGVEVFVAKNECPFAFEGSLVGSPEGRRMPCVEQASGGGGEATSIG